MCLWKDLGLFSVEVDGQTGAHYALIYKLVLLNILKADDTKRRALDSLDIFNIKRSVFETSYGNMFRPIAKVITMPPRF